MLGAVSAGTASAEPARPVVGLLLQVQVFVGSGLRAESSPPSHVCGTVLWPFCSARAARPPGPGQRCSGPRSWRKPRPHGGFSCRPAEEARSVLLEGSKRRPSTVAAVSRQRTVHLLADPCPLRCGHAWLEWAVAALGEAGRREAGLVRASVRPHESSGMRT